MSENPKKWWKLLILKKKNFKWQLRDWYPELLRVPFRLNQFVPPPFCLCFPFTGINFRGMLHHVCDVAYDENRFGPIRSCRRKGTNWLTNYMLICKRTLNQMIKLKLQIWHLFLLLWINEMAVNLYILYIFLLVSHFTFFNSKNLSHIYPICNVLESSNLEISYYK